MQEFDKPLSNPDGRVDVPIDLDRDTLFELMLSAHEKDITLNQHVENILRIAIEKHQQDQMGPESDRAGS